MAAVQKGPRDLQVKTVSELNSSCLEVLLMLRQASDEDGVWCFLSQTIQPWPLCHL